MPGPVKVAVVLGDGVDLKKGSYKTRLDALGNSGEHFEYMIFSGGASNELFEYLTEAGVMAAYFSKRHIGSAGFPRIIREDKGLTIKQKLHYSKKILSDLAETHSPSPLSVVVFCKKPLAVWVSIIVRCVFAGETVPWEIQVKHF